MKTNRLVLHTCEDDVEHLRERGFGCGLVDKVATGQVDVVAGPDGEKNRTLVDLYMWRGDRGQQGLVRETEGGQHFIQGSNAKGISFDSLFTKKKNNNVVRALTHRSAIEVNAVTFTATCPSEVSRGQTHVNDLTSKSLVNSDKCQ